MPSAGNLKAIFVVKCVCGGLHAPCTQHDQVYSPDHNLRLLSSPNWHEDLPIIRRPYVSSARSITDAGLTPLEVVEVELKQGLT
jgi:hypothetical protein